MLLIRFTVFVSKAAQKKGRPRHKCHSSRALRHGIRLEAVGSEATREIKTDETMNKTTSGLDHMAFFLNPKNSVRTYYDQH
jgi:hypothetical protein